MMDKVEQLLEDYGFKVNGVLNPQRESYHYGIWRVGLVKDKVATGYSWTYTYWDIDRIRIIKSYDLRRLREDVEGKGLEWIVVDVDKARRSYSLSGELCALHSDLLKESYSGVTGVKYVYKHKERNGGFRWVYRDNVGGYYSSFSLVDLRDFVLDKGWDWIVMDNDLFLSHLEGGG